MKYLIGIITVLVLGAGIMFWINHNGSATEGKNVVLEEADGALDVQGLAEAGVGVAQQGQRRGLGDRAGGGGASGAEIGHAAGGAGATATVTGSGTRVSGDCGGVGGPAGGACSAGTPVRGCR